MRKLGSLLCVVALATTLLVLRPVPASSTGTVTIDAVLRAQLASASPTTKLLVYGRSANIDTSVGAFASAGVQLIDRFDLIGTAVGVATPASIAKLQLLPASIELGGDPGLRFFLDTSHIATRVPVADATFTNASGPYDGTGVSIAVIDGGVDGTHPMFMRDGVSKVVRNVEMACTAPLNCQYQTFADSLWVDSPANNTDDVAGHGTHVAGIAAGYPVEVDGTVYQGAAPDAKVVALSVATAGSTYYGALAAQYWVVQNHARPCGDSKSLEECPPIKVVNNSYGPDCALFDCTFTVDTEVEMQRTLAAAGVSMVWAAGNDAGTGAEDRVNPPAKDPTPGVIGVASYNDQDTGTRNGTVSSFSSRGLSDNQATWPDISAPGENIASSCQPYQSDCALGLQSPGYSNLSGTSMASPHIAGYVARLLEADGALTPEQVELTLENTAYKFADGAPYAADTGSSFDKGHGLVDVAAALASVLGVAAPPSDPPVQVCDNRTIFVDPAGDAQGLLLFGGTAFPNDPYTDLLHGSVEYAPAAGSAPATLTFAVSVDDLRARDQAPTFGGGEVFDIGFGFGGSSYYIRIENAVDEAPTFALRIKGDGEAGTSDATVANSGITGTFDAVNDVVTATVPTSSFVGTNMETTAPGPGTTIGAGTITVTAYRLNGTGATGGLLTSVDDSTGTCSYEIPTATTSTKPGKGTGRDKNPNK